MTVPVETRQHNLHLALCDMDIPGSLIDAAVANGDDMAVELNNLKNDCVVANVGIEKIVSETREGDRLGATLRWVLCTPWKAPLPAPDEVRVTSIQY